MDKLIKTKKERECNCCDKMIPAASYCIYQEGRVPEYDEESEEQIGFVYFKAWFCNECAPLKSDLDDNLNYIPRIWPYEDERAI